MFYGPWPVFKVYNHKKADGLMHTKIAILLCRRNKSTSSSRNTVCMNLRLISVIWDVKVLTVT